MDTIISKTKKQRISAGFLITMTVVVVAHLGVTYILYRRLDNVTSRYEQTVAHNISMDKIWLKRFEPVYIEIPNASKIKALREDYTKPNSLWYYVNKTVSTPSDYIPNDLINPFSSSENGLLIRELSKINLIKMFDEAAKNGINLKIGSAYRSYEYQTNLFNSNASRYGSEITNQTIAKPGHSEHQLGLAVDIVAKSGACYIETCFENLKEGEWLENNAHNFGFILRYPKNKESITGYSYEPWHFRYVGIELSKALYESNLTFDEAQSYLQKALTTLKSNNAKLN